MNKQMNMKKQIKVWVFLISIILALFYVYYFTSRFENKVITIDDEFSFMTQKSGKNLIMDTDKKIYQITEVYPLLHFDAAELLGTLKPGQTYNVSGFGIRIPVLMMYPIITKINI
jgi:hypothetical protein